MLPSSTGCWRYCRFFYRILLRLPLQKVYEPPHAKNTRDKQDNCNAISKWCAEFFVVTQHKTKGVTRFYPLRDTSLNCSFCLFVNWAFHYSWSEIILRKSYIYYDDFTYFLQRKKKAFLLSEKQNTRHAYNHQNNPAYTIRYVAFFENKRSKYKSSEH